MTIAPFDHDLYPGENHAILTPVPKEDIFGFYGTMKTIAGEETAEMLWDSASLVLSSCFKEDDPAVVRNFLRSRYGRHLADSVTFFAKPEEYGDFDVMHFAVMDAILNPHESGRNKGKSVWTNRFNEIKDATESGEWVD
jgi:hypothetical protein